MEVSLTELELDAVVVEVCRHLLHRPEQETQWPGEELAALIPAGVLRWGIPERWGGIAGTSRQQLLFEIALSQSSLLTAFVLTQRRAALQRIVASQNESLQSRILPRLARGEIFATVGISHLTTSRRHLGRPVVSITTTADGSLLLDGEIPWVSGAAQSEIAVTGGISPEGEIVLVALPLHSPGVTIQPAMSMLALNGSHTSSIRLAQVKLQETDRLTLATASSAAPMPVSAGGISTSAVALGLSRAALTHLLQEASRRPDLLPAVQPLVEEANQLLQDLLNAASQTQAINTHETESLRSRANSLVLRTTQGALIASKGAGFLQGHPVERWVREAQFFLVWSCPAPVAQAALEHLGCGVTFPQGGNCSTA